MKFKNIQTKKKLLSCIFFLCVLVLYHFAMKIYIGDEIDIFGKALSEHNTREFLIMRYNAWSSRLIIEGMLIHFTHNIFLWKMANIVVWSLFAYSLYQLSHKTSLFAVYTLCLMYPLTDMSGAGWIATNMNYLWPLAFGTYSFVALDKAIHEKKLHWWEVLSSFVAAFIGVNMEIYCAIHFALLLYCAFVMCVNKRFPYKGIFIGHYLITCSSLLFIILCPGNSARKSAEVVRWMKNFYEKSFIEKIIDGFESTFSNLLSSHNIFFLIFTAVIFICIWKKTRTAFIRIIGGIPVASTMAVSLGKIDTNKFFSSIINTIINNTGVTPVNWMRLSSYLPLVLYVCIASCIVITFFFIFDDFMKGLECSFIFAVALVSRVVMGFSPTLFASGIRTYMFCYFLMAFLVLRIFEYNRSLFSPKELRRGKYLISVLCAFIILNNIADAGSMF